MINDYKLGDLVGWMMSTNKLIPLKDNISTCGIIIRIEKAKPKARVDIFWFCDDKIINYDPVLEPYLVKI